MFAQFGLARFGPTRISFTNVITAKILGRKKRLLRWFFEFRPESFQGTPNILRRVSTSWGHVLFFTLNFGVIAGVGFETNRSISLTSHYG